MKKLTPGQILKKMRLDKVWTLKELADKLERGADNHRVWDWENGYRSISINFARQLGKVFRVGFDIFL